MRFITVALPIPDRIFNKLNSELNKQLIYDDSMDDCDHTIVVLRPFKRSDFKAA